MNKKIKRLFTPNMRLYFLILAVFAAITFVFKEQARAIAVIELIAVAVLLIYSQYSARRRNSEILEYIESLTYNVDSAAKDNIHSAATKYSQGNWHCRPEIPECLLPNGGKTYFPL